MTEGQDGGNGVPRLDSSAVAEVRGDDPPIVAGDRVYRISDEQCRPKVVPEAEYRAWVEAGNRALDALDQITDESDTEDLWDEVLRNLGVDPATGRGLHP